MIDYSKRHEEDCQRACNMANKDVGKCPKRTKCGCGIYYCTENTNGWRDSYDMHYKYPPRTDLLFDGGE